MSTAPRKRVAKPKASYRPAPIGHPDRDEAKSWVELYRRAQAEPDGIYAERDEDGYALFYIESKDPQHLIDLLDGFARKGTFETPKHISQFVERILIKYEYQQKRAEGLNHEDAVFDIASKRGCSPQTIERRMGKRK